MNIRWMLFVSLLLSVIGGFSSCKKAEKEPQTIFGASVKMGNGNARTFISLNKDGVPQSIGIRLNAAALTGLSNDTTNLEALSTLLSLPSQAVTAGYNHVEIDWNPYGHDPAVYRLPHFDFHFYLISPSEQSAIIPGPDTIPVAAPYVPQDYFSTVDAVPDMGVHWIDATAPELNGETFTDTFIYGFYHGQLIFFEPMVTMATIQSKNSIHLPVKQPQSFQRTGYYPTSQSVYYDSGTSEYVISLDGLQKH